MTERGNDSVTLYRPEFHSPKGESGRMSQANLSEDQFEEKTYQIASPSTSIKRCSSQGCPEQIFLKGDQITCGTFTIPPGKRLGRISAHGSDEIYLILRGTCKVNLPRHEEMLVVKTGEVLYLPAGMIHAPYNDGEEETEVFWACSPTWP